MDIIKSILKERDPETRKRLMESHSYDVKDENHSRPLTEEEMDRMKRDYVKINVEIAALETQLAEVKKSFKDKIDPLKVKHKSLTTDLGNETTYEMGSVYYIDDQDAGIMYVLDVNGNQLDKRPLYKEERQLKMDILKRKNG
jgi:hypothetical protein